MSTPSKIGTDVAFKDLSVLKIVIVARFYIIVFLLSIVGCSPKTQSLSDKKPSWLGSKPFSSGYYTGIGHSKKQGDNNYVQEAKKSALEDLVSEIKVNVSSTSILSSFEDERGFREKYEQIIQTDAADEIEEFELVEAYEDDLNYWVYYRLSKARYREIKEAQKRNAVILSTDYLKKGRDSERNGERVQALGFYFQAFRAVEKYLGEAIPVNIDGSEKLLINEVFGSIQYTLDKMNITIKPNEMLVNRRVNLTAQDVIASVSYKDLSSPAHDVSLMAAFEKGSGDVFGKYKTNNEGNARILINKITSREMDQTIGISLDINEISGQSNSPVYELVVKQLQIPTARLILKVQRPVVFMTYLEKSLGLEKPNAQISNKLRNMLTNAGFEFTADRNQAELWLDVKSDTQQGSVNGSIYVTYATGTIRFASIPEGNEIYSTTFDRVRGYGLDYERSSIDAYNKVLETLENERMREILDTILQ